MVLLETVIPEPVAMLAELKRDFIIQEGVERLRKLLEEHWPDALDQIHTIHNDIRPGHPDSEEEIDHLVAQITSKGQEKPQVIEEEPTVKTLVSILVYFNGWEIQAVLDPGTYNNLLRQDSTIWMAIRDPDETEEELFHNFATLMVYGED